MPELPEVETIARGLAVRVAGDVIESVWLGSKPEPLKSSAIEIEETLRSAKILNVRRSGKHIVFDLESLAGVTSAQWIVHLGMTGRHRRNPQREERFRAVEEIAVGQIYGPPAGAPALARTTHRR